jgi:hypothetical protein
MKDKIFEQAVEVCLELMDGNAAVPSKDIIRILEEIDEKGLTFNPNFIAGEEGTKSGLPDDLEKRFGEALDKYFFNNAVFIEDVIKKIHNYIKNRVGDFNPEVIDDMLVCRVMAEIGKFDDPTIETVALGDVGDIELLGCPRSLAEKIFENLNIPEAAYDEESEEEVWREN